jgi:hypothetical protein
MTKTSLGEAVQDNVAGWASRRRQTTSVIILSFMIALTAIRASKLDFGRIIEYPLSLGLNHEKAFSSNMETLF